MILGLVPTEYNRLLRCMADGHNYSGKVVQSGVKNNLPSVQVEIVS